VSEPAKAKKTLEEHTIDLERAKRHARRVVDAEERHIDTPPPEILTLRERLTRPRPKVFWRISQLQVVGHRVLLAAQFKAGKTTFTGNVVRSLLDGDPFLDTYEVSPISGTVALFDFEMSDTQLDDWYRDIQIVNDDRMLVIPMRGAAALFNIVDPDVRAKWAALLKAHNVTYLILDCVRPVLDALGLNEHTDAGIFLTAFDALLREANIREALVVHHMGHKNERARGDSRLLDWPDVSWTLVRESEDDPASARFLKAYGRDVDVPETQLVFNPTTRRLAVEGGTREDAKGQAAAKEDEQLARKIVEFLRIQPGTTSKEIRQGVNAGMDRVVAALNTLEFDQTIRRDEVKRGKAWRDEYHVRDADVSAPGKATP
jgi:hypothetical protein